MDPVGPSARFSFRASRLPISTFLAARGKNSTKAVAAAGSAMVSMGTAAGSSAPSILTAIAKASLSADAVIVPTCVATAFKMTAAGKINVTVATGPLTAGVIEV